MNFKNFVRENPEKAKKIAVVGGALVGVIVVGTLIYFASDVEVPTMILEDSLEALAE